MFDTVTDSRRFETTSRVLRRRVRGVAGRLGALVALLAFLSVLPADTRAQTPDPPRLTALVVVDQLPAYLFSEYDSLFRGGFRRLLDEGIVFTQASHAYAQTHTAAGHATLGTGTVPARHGVVGNAWMDQGENGWAPMVAVGDSTVQIVGASWADGRSPANLKRGGLANWLLDVDDDARVLSVATKDRAAITLAATAPTEVYWLNTYEVRFVTSTFYRNRLPDWVQEFNEERLPEFFTDSVWVSTVPPEMVGASRMDTVAYEGDGIHTAFPHRYLEEADTTENGAFNFWVGTTPALDAATLAMALEGVREMDLGSDDVPDYLAVSLSQTDIIGHAYGPHSREQLDNLLRLDRELGDFFEGLDDRVGEGRWVVALTSDHGALPMPEYLQEQGIESRRTTLPELQEMIVAARTVQAQGGADNGPQRIAERLAEFPLVEQVFTGAQLLQDAPADTFTTLYARSYHPGRGVGYFGEMDVLVRFPERVIPTTSTSGSDHRSGYWYDRHVPLVFMGGGIPSAVSDDPVRAVDVAPTLFRLMGFEPPEDLDGRVILPPEP